MYWWLNAPVLLTSMLFASILAILFLVVPNRRRERALGIAGIAGVLLYIPACTGIMRVIDQQRFGYFDYRDFTEIPDARWQRFLPEAAKGIRMHQHRGCTRARYRINPAEFRRHLDALWQESGARAFNSRATSTEAVTRAELETLFADLGLPDTTGASGLIRHSGPTEERGAGAIFYLDTDSGVVFQQSCHW